MIRSVGNNQAALQAYSTKLNTNANNIANVNTDNFKRQDAVIEQNQQSQPTAKVRTDNTPGPVKTTISAKGQQKVQELSNTDLTKEFTSTITAQRGYEANLKALETNDQMAGSIINIKG